VSSYGLASEGTNSPEKSKNEAKRYTYSVGTMDANLKYPQKAEPVEMAYQFLELNKEHFRMKEPRQDMVMGEVTTHGKITRVTLKQIYHGIPVDAGARIWFNSNGGVHLFKITYFDDINLPATPSIDSASAAKIALQETGPSPSPKAVCSSKPIIIPSSELFRYNENRFYMAWPVRVYPDSTEKAKIGYFKKWYRYYIDALDGSVLQKGEDSDVKREPSKATGLDNK
jgi:hypothetical protein